MRWVPWPCGVRRGDDGDRLVRVRCGGRWSDRVADDSPCRAAAWFRPDACCWRETPEGLDLDEVRRHLEGVPHVVAVHDLHASTVATGMPILTAHVVVDRDVTMRQAAMCWRGCRIVCASISRCRSDIRPSSWSRRATIPRVPNSCTRSLQGVRAGLAIRVGPVWPLDAHAGRRLRLQLAQHGDDLAHDLGVGCRRWGSRRGCAG